MIVESSYGAVGWLVHGKLGSAILHTADLEIVRVAKVRAVLIQWRDVVNVVEGNTPELWATASQFQEGSSKDARTGTKKKVVG